MALTRGPGVELGGTVYYICLVALGAGTGGMGGIPRHRKGGVTYDVVLVDLADPNALPMRIETTIGTKAFKEYQLAVAIDLIITIVTAYLSTTDEEAIVASVSTPFLTTTDEEEVVISPTTPFLTTTDEEEQVAGITTTFITNVV